MNIFVGRSRVSQTHFNASQSGQALLLGLAMLTVLSVVIFFVFNSGKATTDKIKLVNLADAAAYSGANVIARQLNFMAHTNRVMIANEVAIGHMVSYQAEVETLASGFSTMGGTIGQALKDNFNAWYGESASAEEFSEEFQESIRGIAGIYILSVSANNAAYSNFLQAEYESLLGINGRESIVNNAMLAVLNHHMQQNQVSIELNSMEGIDAVQNSIDPMIARKTESALAYHTQLCQLLYFAKPTKVGDISLSDPAGQLATACQSFVSSGRLAIAQGSPLNPMNDAGILLDLLERSAQASTAGTWIFDRNLDYQWSAMSETWRAQRRGSTQLQWSEDQNRYQWAAVDDSLTIGDPAASLSFNGSSTLDNSSDEIARVAKFGLYEWFIMALSGLCSDISCTSLISNIQLGHYNIQSYPRINPSFQELKISSILTQTPSCLSKLHHRDGDSLQDCDPIEDKKITAVGSAEVFFYSPEEQESQAPNLFNPYWHARLTR